VKGATLGLIVALLAGCGSYVERERELGHRGKAKVNPFLAAERFLESYGYTVESGGGWPKLRETELNLMVLPASALTSEGYLNSLDEWILDGGHAVILLEWGERHYGDWSGGPSEPWIGDGDASEPLRGWLEGQGLGVETSEAWVEAPTEEAVALDGENYEVFMAAGTAVRGEEGEPELLVTRQRGAGRVTVVADARVFRNRYIGDHDHAALLLALAEMSDYGRAVQFVRSTSISFWGLLWDQAWPALVALILLIAFWLWRSLPRFGPLDSRLSESDLRAYDHHLEALGGFHWRLDRAEGLLRPLRHAILERAQHLALSTGHQGDDLFALLAERTGIARERVERAMTFERARDAGSFTRLVADLQTIHLSIP